MVDSKGFSTCKGVLICREEFELPIVHGPLVFDTILDVLRSMFATGVFHAVSDNHAEDMFRSFRFRHISELVADSINGDANGIVESRAPRAFVASHEVVVELHEVGGFDRPPDLIVELEEVEDRLAFCFALFFSGTR